MHFPGEAQTASPESGGTLASTDVARSSPSPDSRASDPSALQGVDPPASDPSALPSAGPPATDPLAAFSSATRDWFASSFAAPTPAQAQAWPAIASGEHVLLSAPTGSGKTLAAFLWAIDRALLWSPARAACASSYVSPLKALSYDIERNLRVPLRGVGAEVTVGIRTGTPPRPSGPRWHANRPTS